MTKITAREAASDDNNLEFYSLGKVDSFIIEMDLAKSPHDVLIALKENIEDLGFERFGYQIIEAPTGKAKNFYVSAYPREWIERYNEQKYISADILGRMALRTVRPFLWTEAGPLESFTPEQQKLILEAREFGINSGGMIALHGPGPIKALFTVTSRLSQAEFERFFVTKRHVVHLIATYAHERLIQMGYHKELPRGFLKLSPREVEILTWAAEGRNSEEIADKLNRSLLTINKHLQNICIKLGVKNQKHAVSVGICYGLIMPRVTMPIL